MKKIIKTALVTFCCFGLFGSVALATSPAYSFNLYNTGQTYNYDYGSSNTKVSVNEGWTLRVTSISVNSNSYGMSFVPVRYYSDAWRISGNPQWRKATGKTTGTYGSGQAVLTTYLLAARIDDDYYGPFSAAGTWNSDT